MGTARSNHPWPFPLGSPGRAASRFRPLPRRHGQPQRSACASLHPAARPLPRQHGTGL
jgi:hypothetical protein